MVEFHLFRLNISRVPIRSSLQSSFALTVFYQPSHKASAAVEEEDYEENHAKERSETTQIEARIRVKLVEQLCRGSLGDIRVADG